MVNIRSKTESYTFYMQYNHIVVLLSSFICINIDQYLSHSSLNYQRLKILDILYWQSSIIVNRILKTNSLQNKRYHYLLRHLIYFLELDFKWEFP